MPHDGTTRGLDPGTRAEVRVAQAWFWDGYYVRRGIDLQHRFGDDVSSVTDLDVLAISFDLSLKHNKTLGEVKTGRSSSTPRPLDRALWLRGLRELVQAGSAEITTAFRTSPGVRDACRRLGVSVQHLDDLDRRERRLRMDVLGDLGSQGETIAKIRRDVHSFVKQDSTLERAFWFLTSEVWFLEPFDALKRTLGIIREIGKSWPPESHSDAMNAARWFFAESISVVGLNLALITGESITMDAASFRDVAYSRLATGDAPYYAVKGLSARFDEYLAKILHSVNAPPEVLTSAVGAFLPVPPNYAEPLLELIARLGGDAESTAAMPRQLDALLFERLVRRRNLSGDLHSALHLSLRTERQVKLIGAFLRGQFALPEAVDRVLTAPLLKEAVMGEGVRERSNEQGSVVEEMDAKTHNDGPQEGLFKDADLTEGSVAE